MLVPTAAGESRSSAPWRPPGGNFPGGWSVVGRAGILRSVWYGAVVCQCERLTSTSYLVLGLLAREGPSTPYELERHVRGDARQLLVVPAHAPVQRADAAGGLGLVVEERETEGRRRRVFAITPAGEAALAAWLDRPPDQPTELRDLGLLQLFFGDLASAESRLRLAEQQLAIHRPKLAAYQEDDASSAGRRRSGRGQRTVEHWRGETLRMGLLYELAAVDFWTDVAERARASLERNGIATAPERLSGALVPGVVEGSGRPAVRRCHLRRLMPALRSSPGAIPGEVLEELVPLVLGEVGEQR